MKNELMKRDKEIRENLEDMRETKRVLARMREAVATYRHQQEDLVEEKDKEISALIENKNKEVSSVIQERKKSLEDKNRELAKLSQVRKKSLHF